MASKLSNPNALHNRVNGSGIIGSSNGFLCLFRHNKKNGSLHFSVSNPITGESIPLPITKGACCRDNGPVHCGFGFGFSSVSHVYKVVMFRKRNPRCNKAKCIVLTVGSGIWRTIGKLSSTPGQLQTTNGVFHDGFIHWICKCKRSPSRYIRAFDVESSERLKNLPMPPCETTAKIGVLNGSLSITSFSWDTLQVWLMKECRGKKFWTRELEIHDRCLQGHIIEVLKLIKRKRAPLKVLLLVDSRLSLYTPATSSLVEVQIDGIPYRAKKDVASVHIPSFVSPKDIIRDYISKHPEEVAETSDIRLPSYTDN